MEIFRGDLVDLKKDLSLFQFPLLGWRRFSGEEFHSASLRKLFCSLGKRKLARLHQKGKNISPFTASEAVKNLFLFVYHEGGGFFGMEGTEPLVVLPCLLEADVVRNDLQDAGALPDL